MALNAANVTVALGLTGVQATVGGLARVNGALGGLASRGGALAAALGRTLLGAGAAGLAGLGVLGGLVGKTGLGFLALKEQAQVAFTTMLGSGAKATAFLDELQAFAARTPFEFPDLVAGARRLLALGFTADQVLPTLTIVGDAVAGLGGGAEQIDRVTLALGQMQTRGKVSAEEMNQLAENGIPAWRYLAAAIGVDIPRAMKMAEKGQISAAVGTKAILAGMQRDFGGMMAAQATTWDGLLSTVKDVGRQLAAAFMQPVFDRALKPALGWLANWLQGPGVGAVQGWGARFAGVVDRGVGAFREFREVLGGGLGAGGVGSTLATYALLVRDTIARRVVPALQLLWRTFGGGVDAGRGLRAYVLLATGLIERLGRGFQLGVDGIVTFKQALTGGWSQTAGGNAFTEALGRIGLALRGLGGVFREGGLSATLGTLWSAYLSPALEQAWAGLTRFVAEKAPQVGEQLRRWWEAFNGWALTTALPAVKHELGLLADGIQGWVATDGYPLLKRAAGALWAAFRDAWSGNGQPQLSVDGIGLTNGLDEQVYGPQVRDNFLVRLFSDALNGLNTWMQTTGAEAFKAVLGDLNTWLLAQAPVWLRSWDGLWQAMRDAPGQLNQWLLDRSPAWLRTWGGLGSALGQALLDGLRAILPDWAEEMIGLTRRGAGAGAGQGGQPPDFAVPGPSQGSYLGTDGRLHQYAPGAAGGYQIPGATGTGYQETTVTTTNTNHNTFNIYGVAPAEVAQQIYSALAPMLETGGASGGAGGGGQGLGGGAGGGLR